jgi:hypothetical protein
MASSVSRVQRRRHLHRLRRRCIGDMRDDDEHRLPTKIKGEGAITAYQVDTSFKMYSFSRHYQTVVCFEVSEQNVQILLMV